MRDDDPVSNPTRNSAFEDVCAARRALIRSAGAGAALTLAGMPLAGCATPGAPIAPLASPATPAFRQVPAGMADTVVVPEGYEAYVLFAWGDPVGAGPAFRQDATNTAADQEQQAGMHHDALHYFPMIATRDGRAVPSSEHGLLVVNHEYTDDGLLHPDGMKTWNAAKVRKAQAAHGVSVIEVRKDGERWRVVRPSTYARRITGYTPVRLSGPAAGAAALRTRDDPAGRTVFGTLNNCAHGVTPWGTFLTGEENFNGYFVNPSGDVVGVADGDQKLEIIRGQSRYGITRNGFGYRWHEHDERFDASRHPNEPNRFGWVVEVDPWDPSSTPVKRTALGRCKHEGATVTLAKDGRVVVYTGDDERFEYIYKFVSSGRYQPGNRAANRDLLDEGTLYVARFDANGEGHWLPLVSGTGPLTAANGFASQADVLVRARSAGDALGATRMDRPEWIAVSPGNGDVYCTLTNNSQRGGKDRPGADPANPRAANVFGHIVRWSEAGGDAASTSFAWNIFAECGDPSLADATKRGNVRGDAYGSPDGLWFDPRGLLWIQTDISTSAIGKGDYAKLGNNMMLAADVATGETRRFLVGPRGCEVTGVVLTPDMRTMFVDIQHPGESPSERSDPDDPKAVSGWPDGAAGGRPRSATIVVRRRDGGIVGT
jgi:secreted PhoX family phosphatase